MSLTGKQRHKYFRARKINQTNDDGNHKQKEMSSNKLVRHNCSICDKSYSTFPHMFNHERKAHKIYRCTWIRKHPDCKFVSKNEEDLFKHIEVHKKDLTKRLTHKQNKLKPTTNSHLKFHKNKSKVENKCNRCDFQEHDIRKYNDHCVYYHADICKQCGLPVEGSRKRKGQKGRQITSHECPANLGVMSKNKILKDKILSKHEYGYFLLDDKRYLCPECNFVCQTEFMFLRHKYLMHKSQICPDNSCNVTCKNRPELYEHMINCHKDMCTNCGVTLTSEHNCEKTIFFGQSPLAMKLKKLCRPVACSMCKFLAQGSKHLTGHVYHVHKKGPDLFV